jgi:hypothetical protein
MLGYCGINCTECSAYKATVTTDQKLMQHVQDTFGDGKGTLTDWVCLGCLSNMGLRIALPVRNSTGASSCTRSSRQRTPPLCYECNG